MARASPIQSNFNAGEFSPLLQGRVDAERYKQGLARCENAIPMLQGPVTRRSGSRFVAEVKTSSLYTKLIPFKYSNTQAYMLEFGNTYIRFFTNRAQITGPYEIASPYSTSDLPNLKFVQSLDVLYLVHPNYKPRKLKRYGNTDWVLEIIQFKDGPYLNLGLDPQVCAVTSLIHVAKMIPSGTSGSVSFTTVTGDYAALAIAGIVDNGSGVCRVTFVDADEFADRSQIFIYGATGTTGANGTWVAKKINSTTYDLAGSVFNAAYIGSGKVAPAPFKSTDVGRFIRHRASTNPWGYAQITAYTDGAHVTATVISAVVASNSIQFQLGVWSDSTGYPSCCIFHGDRLYFAGSRNALQRIDGSNVSDYENFAPTALDNTITDSNAVSFSLNSTDANAINWMTSDEYGMPIGTSGGPWVLRASNFNEAITSKNVSAKRITNVGIASTPGVLAGKSTIYLESSTRKVREMTYYYNIDGFRSVDLTEIAEHLPAEGISTEIVFQATPQPIVWCGREDGLLLGMTYDRNLDALRTGWHKHYLGGVSDTAGNPPIIESLAVIPSPDGTVDDVWFVVKRYINGVTVRYIEYFNKIFEDFDILPDAYFVDCGATFDSPLTVISVSNTNPANVNVTAHGLVTGDQVRFTDIVGLENGDGENVINGPPFNITVIDANNFTLDGFDGSVLTPFISGGVVRKMVHTISGLTWIKGETVSLLGDGAVLTDAVVSNAGVITLPYPAGVVQIGLGYSSKIQQLRLEAGAADGTSLGKNRRIEQASVMVNRSESFEVGMAFDSNMYEVITRETTDPMDQAPPLFTGIKDRIQISSNYDTENQLCFRVSKPTPFTLVAVMPQQTTYDKG